MMHRFALIAACTWSVASSAGLCSPSSWRAFVGEMLAGVRKETADIQWILRGIDGKVENSVWKSPEHRELADKIGKLMIVTRAREASAVIVDENFRDIPLNDGEKLVQEIEGLGGRAHLDTEGTLTGTRNLVVIDALPPPWKGTPLETTFLATQAFGASFAINPQLKAFSQAAGAFFLSGEGTIVSPYPPFNEYTALHEIRHLLDYHDPQHWVEAIRLTENSKTTSLRENERRLSEQKASREVLDHIAMQSLVGSASAQSVAERPSSKAVNEYNLGNYHVDLVANLLREGKYQEAYRTFFNPSERAALHTMGVAISGLAAATAVLWWNL